MNRTKQPHPAAPFQRYLSALRVLGLVALLALALTPFIMDPGARDDAFFTPKWAWIAIWTALGIGSVLARAMAGRAVLFLINEVWIGAIALALWHWVAVLWAPSRSLAVERAAQITWLTLALLVGMQFLIRRRALLWIARLGIAVGVVTALWVLAEDAVRAWLPQYLWIQPNLSDWRGYLSAGLGNTNHIGDLLALALLPTLTLFGEARTRRAKLRLFLAALLLPAGLIVSYSVGSNLGLLAGAAVMLAMTVWHNRGRWFLRRKARWFGLGAAWIVVVLFFVLDHPANPHRPGILKQGFGSERWHEGGPTRLAIWAEGLEMVKQHPLLGIGTGNFTYVFPEMDSRLIWDRPDLMAYQGSYTNAGHNELLQAWAELGIGGLFLLLLLIGLAYRSLFADLALADRPSFLIRATLAGLLTGWVVQAQMNFIYQHPAGALTLYMILLAIIIEKRTRPGYPAMPSLKFETGLFALQVDWRNMSKPTAAGLALVLPRPLAVTFGIALLLAIAVWAPLRLRPVLSQREYKLGMLSEAFRDPKGAEAHFQRALKLDPDATGCRSHYSQWLINQGRPQDGLNELKIVRERLNSNELWTRQAQACLLLGQRSEAEKALMTYQARVWRSRQSR